MDLTNHKKSNRRKTTSDLSTMVYGKVLPQAMDLEAAVLGAIMLEKEAFDDAFSILKNGSCFYKETHQRIFNAMVRLNQASKPIDILTVQEELRSSEELDLCGGSYYVTSLTNSVVSGSNIEFHSKIIYQKFYQREMIRICGETINDCFDEGSDPFEISDAHEKQLTELSISKESNSVVQIDGELVSAMKRIVSRTQLEDHITGVPSLFYDLDKITHGWQNTDLIILAARPSVGKTALALQLARNAAKNPRKITPTAFFSLEMSKGQLIERLISAETEIWLEKISTGRLDPRELQAIYESGIQKLSGSSLFIDDTPAINIFQLRAKCRKLKRKNNIGLIVIDYLQLMSGIDGSGKGANREQEISTISRGLKGLAKELNIPIIALSQLSRKLEERKGDAQIPKLSDLRESGAIEQDADMVCFIYRPEYHDVKSNEMGDSTSGETHIKIAKHRNGTLGTIQLRARLEVQKFESVQKSFFTAPLNVPKGFVSVSSLREREEDDITF